MNSGDLVQSKNWGEAKILTISGDRVNVEFVNTGNKYNVHRVAMYNGMFSDTIEKKRLKEEKQKEKEEAVRHRLLSKSVYGVGFLGEGKYQPRQYPHHIVLWRGMIRRCYHNGVGVQHYEDCTVDERWHCFQTFCEDIQHLPGYTEWSKFERGVGGRNLYCLDKDLLNRGNRVYSRDNCQFITHSLNSSDALSGGRVTYQFLKEGEIITVTDLNKWCNELGYSVGNFRSMLHGLSKSTGEYVVYNPAIPIEDHPQPYKKKLKNKFNE